MQPAAQTNPTERVMIARGTSARGWQGWLERMERQPLRALGLIMLLAVGLRLINLGRDLWVDELITWNAVRLPLGEMFRERLQAGHLPFYFAAMRLLPGVEGTNAHVLRLPSLLLNLACIPLIFHIGRLAFRPRIALLAALLLAMHSGSIWSAQIIRAYALQMLLFTLSSYCLLHYERERRWQALAGLGLATLAGLLTQAQYAFMLVVQVLYVVGSHRKRLREFWPLLATLLAPVPVVIPFYHMLGESREETRRAFTWVGIPYEDVFEMYAGLMVGEYRQLRLSATIIFPFTAMALGVIIIAVRALDHRGRLHPTLPAPITRPREQQGMQLLVYLLYWAVLQPALLYVYINGIDLEAKGLRYFWPMLPGWCLLTAVCLGMVHRPIWRRGIVAFSLAGMLYLSSKWLAYPGDGLQQTIREVDVRIRPGERIVGMHDQHVGNGLVFSHYAWGRGANVLLLDRDTKDSGTLLNAVRGHVPLDSDFWLILHHKKDNPLYDLLRKSAEFDEEDKIKRGQARAYRFERLRQPRIIEPD